MAFDGKLTEHIVPSLRKMDSFVKEWNIGVSDQRELFRIISNTLKENKRCMIFPTAFGFFLHPETNLSPMHSLTKEYFYILKKYLSTFTVADSYSMNEAKEDAVQAIIEFIKAPDMFQVSLFVENLLLLVFFLTNVKIRKKFVCSLLMYTSGLVLLFYIKKLF